MLAKSGDTAKIVAIDEILKNKKSHDPLRHGNKKTYRAACTIFPRPPLEGVEGVEGVATTVAFSNSSLRQAR